MSSSRPQSTEKNKYQILIDRYTELDIEAILQEGSKESLENKNVDDIINLLPRVNSLLTALESLQSDAEKQLITDFKCHSNDIEKNLNKEFKHSKIKKLCNESEYNTFRITYGAIINAIPNIKTTLNELFQLLPVKQKQEDTKKTKDKIEKQDTSSPTTSGTPPETWLSEPLAQYAAKQFQAESGMACGCSETNESTLVTQLLIASKPLAEKEQAIEQYLKDSNTDKLGLLRYILSNLKSIAQANQTEHWLTDDENAKAISTTFNTRKCAPLFNTFTAKSIKLTVDFLTIDNIPLKDKQIVADYYLGKNQQDRLGLILGAEKQTGEKRLITRNNRQP